MASIDTQIILAPTTAAAQSIPFQIPAGGLYLNIASVGYTGTTEEAVLEFAYFVDTVTTEYFTAENYLDQAIWYPYTVEGTGKVFNTGTSNLAGYFETGWFRFNKTITTNPVGIQLAYRR